MKKPLSRVCECNVCEETALTKQTALPEGWCMLWEPSYTLCDTCLDNWRTKWGEPPVWGYGPEKELMLI